MLHQFRTMAVVLRRSVACRDYTGDGNGKVYGTQMSTQSERGHGPHAYKPIASTGFEVQA